MPKISVIIPFHNQAPYLDDAVSSVLAQTYQDFEIVIVNDGSTDPTAKTFINSYLKPKTRVIHIPHQGLAQARNTGIRNATGKYILPLDADDKIGPTYLEMAVKILDTNPKVGIVYCLAEFFGNQKGHWPLHNFSMERMLMQNIIFCSGFFRKSDWKKVGGYRSAMQGWLEDWDFWLYLLELGVEVYRIPKTNFYYRIRKGSMNEMVNQMTEEQKIAMRTQIFKNHQSLYLSNIQYIIKNLDVNEVRNSWSYRIGCFITQPLSKIIYFKNRWL